MTVERLEPRLTWRTGLPVRNRVSVSAPAALSGMHHFRIEGETPDIFSMSSTTVDLRRLIRTFLTSTGIGAAAAAVFAIITTL